MESFKNLTVLDHPLIQHKLSILRDKNTGVKQFREIVGEIAMLMTFETTRDMPLQDVVVETPVATPTCRQLAGKKVAIVPILRAGLGMVDGVLQIIPSAKVGHIGLYRDPDTLAPVEYYCKMPTDIDSREVIFNLSIDKAGAIPYTIQTSDVPPLRGARPLKYRGIAQQVEHRSPKPSAEG